MSAHLTMLTAAVALDDGASLYIERLRRRGRSANTLYSYSTDLRQYGSYVRSRGDSELVALQAQRQVEGWLDALSAAGVTTRSQSRKLTVLRTFFKFAKVEGWIGHDPTSQVAVRFRAKRVIAPELDALHRMVDGIPRDSRMNIRDRAMLRLALDAAIRIGECAALDIPGVGSQSTVDLQRKLVHVVGKGGDTETVAINDRTVAFVEEWLRIRPFAAADGEHALFVSARGVRISRQMLHVMCKRRAADAGLESGFSWHMFRHRRIGQIFEQLGSRVAQAHARHAATSTTENIYGHHSETRMRALIRGQADIDAARAQQ